MPPWKALPAAMMQEHGAAVQKGKSSELAYIDTLANPKIRLDGVKRMTQIQNTS